MNSHSGYMRSKRLEKKDIFRNSSSSDVINNDFNSNDFNSNYFNNNDFNSNDLNSNDSSEIIHSIKKKKCKKNKTCNTICDRLCLEPPKGACENRRVVHKFKVVLGECKVTRDVNITHCITANLDHHIKEYITCKHEACAKNTQEVKHNTVDGKCCNVKFPDCDDHIDFVDNSSQCSESTSNSNNHKKSCNRKHKNSKFIF
jgi:hypothetical protein